MNRGNGRGLQVQYREGEKGTKKGMRVVGRQEKMTGCSQQDEDKWGQWWGARAD